ncbi:SH3 domain-containing protein [Bartonella sp. B10]
MFKNNFLSTTVILLSFAGTVFGVSVSSATAGTVARVASGYAVIRTGPATTYKAVATVPSGGKVQINGCLPNKTWCSIHYNGMTGWASAHYLNVKNIPMISLGHMHTKPDPTIQAQKGKVQQIVSNSKVVMIPPKIQKQHRIDVVVDSTGVKKRDERTILNPSPKAHGISVEHVTAYNPLFPDNVNFRNFERNETRYRVVTYPSPSE